jgi:hypothetical protein
MEPIMNSEKKTSLVTRDALLKLLSDDEVASVSSAETAGQLADGEEYLDLQNLDKGVRKAKRGNTLAARVLPKKAIHAKTWEKILAQLKVTPAAVPPTSA